MGKYGQVLGLWDLNINGTQLRLKPKKGDNLRMAEILAKVNQTKDQGLMMKEFAEFVKGLIKRDCPPDTPEEQEELDLMVEFNILELIKETMIAFRWSTRDKYAEMEKEQVKNLIAPNQ